MTRKICIVLMLSLLLCGCSSDFYMNMNTNHLGGTGDLHFVEGVGAAGAAGVLYDDENIYFELGDIIYKLDKNGRFMLNCDIATCKHESQECKAYTENGGYFVYNDKLYQIYNIGEDDDGMVKFTGYIRDCTSGETVFSNSIPEGLDESKKLAATLEINYVIVINDEYMKIKGHRHTYIVDKNFDIVCWYGDFYRYSIKTGSKTKIAENVWLFSVFDGNIYADRVVDGEKEKLIFDYDGNIKFVYDDNFMQSDNLVKIENKLYSYIGTEEKRGIASINMDGTGYEFYELLE